MSSFEVPSFALIIIADLGWLFLLRSSYRHNLDREYADHQALGLRSFNDHSFWLDFRRFGFQRKVIFTACF